MSEENPSFIIGNPLVDYTTLWAGYEYDTSAADSSESTQIILDGVPAYLWTHGCSPTAAGMVIGYWDANGYPDLVPGDASTQTSDVNNMIASDQHYWDYSYPIDSEGNILPDKSSTGGAHVDNCLADFLGTSRSADNLWYGTTWNSYIYSGIGAYGDSREGVVLMTEWEVMPYFTWDHFTAEIDAGRPMVFDVDSDADGTVDHSVAAVGYDSELQRYACYNTWDTSIHWFDFARTSPGQPWGIYSASFVIPRSPVPVSPMDLYGTYFDVPVSAAAGDEIRCMYEVTNGGGIDAKYFKMGWYLSTDDIISTSDYRLDGPNSLYVLHDGRLFRDFELTLPAKDDPFWAANAGDGTYYIGMIIDTENIVAESNEDNNCSVGIGLDLDVIEVSDTMSPDLYGSYFDAPNSATAGAAVEVNYEITKVGGDSTSLFHTGWYLSADTTINTSDLPLGGENLSLASYGSTGTLLQSLALPAQNDPYWLTHGGDGTYYIGMIIDTENIVAESNEDNNCSVGIGLDLDVIEVSDTMSPDLYGSYFDAPNSATAGAAVEVNYEITNVGGDSTPLFHTGWYLSADATIDTSDRLLYGEDLTLNGNSNTGPLSKYLILPAMNDQFWNDHGGNGNYYIGLIIDTENAVVEADETNNSNRGIGLDLDAIEVSATLFVPAIESFDSYANLSAIDGQAGGTGWTDAWTTDADGTYIAESGSLVYAGYKDDSSGNKAHLTPVNPAAWNIYRTLETPYTGDDVFYVSFLAEALNDSLRYFGVALFGTTDGERTLYGSGSGFADWTVNHITADALDPNLDGTSLRSGVTTQSLALIVVKVEMHSDGFENVTFWVNPDVTVPEDVTTAVGGKSYLTETEYSEIGRIRIGGGGANATYPTAVEHYIDEIRIGGSPFAAIGIHPGDANGDGLVNLSDLQILGDNWQSTTASWAEADFTGDGIVNLADLQILGDNWGYGTSTDVVADAAVEVESSLQTQSTTAEPVVVEPVAILTETPLSDAAPQQDQHLNAVAVQVEPADPALESSYSSVDATYQLTPSTNTTRVRKTLVARSLPQHQKHASSPSLQNMLPWSRDSAVLSTHTSRVEPVSDTQYLFALASMQLQQSTRPGALDLLKRFDEQRKDQETDLLTNLL